ncbi:MAG TPA: hypothetical protein VFU07_02525 [Candidatus Lumbricidophila sp.]|nr:hypothetical protein [Candidatus Lumbricidophila sp.]
MTITEPRPHTSAADDWAADIRQRGADAFLEVNDFRDSSYRGGDSPAVQPEPRR